ncbi:uncharacterized protein Gasu_47420 [Galdieria sulphuraria]|uniref:26S proteasome complex subunit DSS1 n=1 Tax=Galdieria sulphuraria TaxID=130081 RepID=M2VWX9_GALSU|nr:uncharacterized protein Gasu_47420 [Galdieria sulphuraria]EME27756.1 hypothetical protein Gasu_47420 [Galdieria sulphuraria]|eukprot:XP_005704276.1 hypothetical protein Gasu_47420 [Galdieria sulphuraria]
MTSEMPAKGIHQETLQNSRTEASNEFEVLEDDDEFEEFEDEEWTLQNEDGAVEEQEWEEDWDDEAADDDFIIQLRTELKNQGVLKEES